MRLWSLHPSLLDSKGLVACWRESLLAQKVLLGQTKGYKNHSQLERFKKHESPINAIVNYLDGLLIESLKRGYNFDEDKIFHHRMDISRISVTSKQVRYEFHHLQNKLMIRDKKKHESNLCILSPMVHPIFRIVDGEIESWEKRE